MITAFKKSKVKDYRYYLLLLGFTMVYFATAKLGLHFAFHGTNATPVWIPAGISLVIILKGGYKYWPAIFLGGFLVNLNVIYIGGFNMQIGLLIGLFTGIGNTLEALLGAYLIRRFILGTDFLQTLKNTRVFIFYVAFVATLISAIIGTTVFCGFTNNWSVYIQMLFVWWFGDAMGILIVAPLLIFWGKWNFKNWQWSRYLEFVFYILIVSFFAFIMYKTNYPVKFLLVPLLVWCIFRFGKFESFLIIFLICAFVVWTNYHGANGQGLVHFKNLLVFQLYFGSIAFTFLLVSASLDEQKKSQTLLIESSDLIQNLIDNTPSMINVVDTEGKLLLVNKAFLKLYDQSKGNIIGFNRESFMPKEIAEAHRTIDMQIIAQKKAISFDENIEELNSIHYYHTNKFPLIDRANNIYAVCGMSTDITEQKTAEKALHESNYRNKILFDYAPIPIWEEDFSIVKKELEKIKVKGIKDFANYFDQNFKELEKLTAQVKIIAVNKKSLEFYEVDDIVQLTSTLNDWFVDESWNVFKNELIALINGKTKYETEIKIKTPKGFDKYLFLSLNIPPDSHETWDRVFVSFVDITQRKEIELELDKYHKNLEKLVEERTEKLEEQSSILKESQDALLFLLEDINESRDELANLNEKLQESNNELEAFTYSVSHDLKAPLRAIDGFSKFLLEDYSEKLDAEGVRLLNVIRDNTKKMDTLILDLLNLSRIGKTEMSMHEMEMSQFVKDVVRDLLSESEKNKINIHIENLYTAKGDANLLKQVWINLISNAIKFTKNTKKPEIMIGATIEEESINYFVKDNGVGFNPEYKNKLFGVFQRLHKTEDFEGSGVGLAIVKRIVKRHGGKVWADGVLGKGATFSFSLPKQLTNKRG